jgi:hypothetical protein
LLARVGHGVVNVCVRGGTVLRVDNVAEERRRRGERSR